MNLYALNALNVLRKRQLFFPIMLSKAFIFTINLCV